jgi:hypothetical protein
MRASAEAASNQSTVICPGLGFAADILSVVRAYEGMQNEFTARTGGRIGHKVPDED